MMKKSIAAFVALGLVVAACGGDDSTDSGSDAATESEASSSEASAGESEELVCSPDTMETFAKGKLTVATGEPVYQPWMVDDDPSNGEGFESAFVYALADRLGYTAENVEWVRTTFDEGVAPGAKDYDFNIQQYTITPERDEIVDFSEPYYVAQRVVLAMEGTPADGATTFEELKAAKWGATVGTHDLDYIETVMGISDVAVFDDQAATQTAMTAGQVDATVVNLPSAFYLTAVELEGSVIAGILPEGGQDTEEFGLLLADGSPLKPCLDQAITSMHTEGTIEALETKWLAAGGDIPTISK